MTRTHFGREALMYAEGDGTGHNGAEARNMYVSTVNMLPGVDYADQMEEYWMHARANHIVQVLRIVQSFSLHEFNPDDPHDILKANLIGQELVREHYPNRQAVVYTQIDGKGGKVHNHVMISDVSMEDYKGCTPEQTHYKSIEKWTDEIAERYTVLDNGKSDPKEKITQTECAKREAGKYVLKDDIRMRVKLSMNLATSEEDFIQRCMQNGLGVTVKDNKSHGHYYTYELLDFSRAPEGEKAPKNTKARSYSLGGDYGYEALMERIRERGLQLSTDVSDVSSIGGHHRNNPEKTQHQEEETTTVPTAAEEHVTDVGAMYHPEEIDDGFADDQVEQQVEQSGTDVGSQPVPEASPEAGADVTMLDDEVVTEPVQTVEQTTEQTKVPTVLQKVPEIVSEPKASRKKASEMTPEERMIMFARKEQERLKREELRKRNQDMTTGLENAVFNDLKGHKRVTSTTADEMARRFREMEEKEQQYGE